MAELVDAPDSKSGGATRESSSLSPGRRNYYEILQSMWQRFGIQNSKKAITEKDTYALCAVIFTMRIQK